MKTKSKSKRKSKPIKNPSGQLERGAFGRVTPANEIEINADELAAEIEQREADPDAEPEEESGK
jgi:hypothetical protein